MSNWKRKLKRHVIEGQPALVIYDESHSCEKFLGLYDALENRIWAKIPTFYHAGETNLERGARIHASLEQMLSNQEIPTREKEQNHHEKKPEQE